jgi:ADP-dependent NAD(P)H-hydrate dehydratase / NAD(P)H-hydrate epimerase
MNIKKELKSSLGKRKRRSHKGDYGRILVLAGSRGMSGACYLASNAALRSGAGLVTVGLPKSLVNPLSRRFTEAMMLPLAETSRGTLSVRARTAIKKNLRKQDVLVIGPGLSTNKETQSLVRQIVSTSEKPMVIDADGLNAFKGKASRFKKLKVAVVLTPHEGEFNRLFGGGKMKSESDRKKKAITAARKYRVTVVLKGHRTVVASPDGATYINRTGNPGMATGGSGDVLTGVIGAMLGHHIDPFSSACIGVHVHGRAGDLASKKVGELSLIAGDILDFLPDAFRTTLKKGR